MHLSAHLKAMFSALDDALFELAETADTAARQKQYFDVMHRLRVQKDPFINQFKSGITQQFRHLYKHRQVMPIQVHEEPAIASAVPSMRDRALQDLRNSVAQTHSDELRTFSQRLNRYFNIRLLNSDNVPLGSLQFVNLFAQLLAKLDISESLRMVLCEYFKRFVIAELGPLLCALNDMLAEQGLVSSAQMSEVDSAKPSAESRLALPAQPSDTGFLIDEDAIPTLDFEHLQGILAQNFERGLNKRLFSAKRDVLGPELDTTQIVAALQTLRNKQLQQFKDRLPLDRSNEYEPRDIRLLIEHQLIQLVRQNQCRQLHQGDDDAMTLIATLFELMFDDPNYPEPLARLFIHLQIPATQTALVDKTLFSNSRHPFRRLVKLISLIAVGWELPEDDEEDLAQDQIKQIILLLLKHYQPGNYDSIIKLEGRLQQFVIMESKVARKIEQQVRARHKHKTSSRPKKAFINQLILDRTQGKKLPVSVVYMIKGPYASYLQQQAQKHGEGSEQWREALHLLDNLLWCIQPDSYQSNLGLWQQLKAEIQTKLSVALLSIDLEATRVDGLTASIVDVFDHIHASKGLVPPMNCITVDHTASEPGTVSSYAPPPETPGHQQLLRARKFRSWAANIGRNRTSDQLRKAIANFSTGDWIELIGEDGRVRRCRLVESDQPSAPLLFVARDGTEVLNAGKEEITHLLQNNQMLILESASFWDRGLKQLCHEFTTQSHLETVV